MDSQGGPTVSRDRPNDPHCSGDPCFGHSVRPSYRRKFNRRPFSMGRDLGDSRRSSVKGGRMSNARAYRRARDGTIRERRSVIRHGARGRQRLFQAIVCYRQLAINGIFGYRVCVTVTRCRPCGIQVVPNESGASGRASDRC